MKILVTGGAGYIGSHTIVELTELPGMEVISADNFSNSTAASFDRIERITAKRILNHPVDLTDLPQVKSLFEQHKNIAGIIHFAALKAVGESVEYPLVYFRNNIISLLNLLQCATQYGVNTFIFSSSCTVYGNIERSPVSEDTPLLKPLSPYGYTKQAGERMIEDFCAANPEFNAVNLRYFNPAGAHLSGNLGELPLHKPNNLVPVITQTAAGILDKMYVYGKDYNTRDGSCIRDYVHVSDIARAHVLALKHIAERRNRTNCEVFNLGTGRGVSVVEMIASFEKVSGEKLKYEFGPRRPGDIEAIYSDCTKAETILGWKPALSIDEMMDSAWRWQKNLK